ncbi:MAG: peroxiredoxin [Gemmatales bacterium]|nr:peroxiredoxin [Gemmatales bacterium]MDW7993868.1 peroxiredoxin [Gemmatales bacterium]
MLWKLVSVGLLLAVGLAAVVMTFAELRGQPAEVAEGKPAPKVELPAVNVSTVLPDHKDGKTLALDTFRGKKNIVLFFYPKALTPGCTVESCGFRDRVEQFAQLDTVVIGISVDDVELQSQFVAKHNLNFPLLCDTQKTVSKAFGVLGANGLSLRKTFVIDKQGIIRKIYDQVDVRKHPDEVLAWIKENLK